MPDASTTTSAAAQIWIGSLSALGATLIWAAWIVATRDAMASPLTLPAVTLLRFGVPALIFAPVWLRTGLWPRGIKPLTFLALMLPGVPYFLVAAYAMRTAPAAEAGPLLSGSMPLMVALISIVVLRERVGSTRILGLVLIAAGILAIGGLGLIAGGYGWHAHLLLLCASSLWAIFTHVFKRSGLTTMEAAALPAIWSIIVALPLGVPDLYAAVEAGLWHDIGIQALMQGLASGVIAFLLYGFAVERLGAQRGAAFVALVPPLAALIAIPALGEWPGEAALFGIVATAAGVALASGLLERRSR